MVNWKDLVKSYLTDDEPKGDPIEKTYDREFDLPAGGQFRLKTIRGSVRITTHAKPSLQVHAVMISETGDQERLDKLSIIEKVQPNQVTLEVDYSAIIKIKARDGIFVHFTIAMPEGCDLTLDCHKSDYEIDAPSGQISIISGKASGNVKGIRNNFQLQNSKGRFTGDFDGPHAIQIVDQGGNIQLNVRGAQDYSVTGCTHKGLININGADVKQTLSDKRQITLDGTLGAGTHPLNLSTQKGNINVSFLG